MLIDTHAHLDFPEFAGDLEAVLGRAKTAGVHEMVTIGISLASSEKAVELAPPTLKSMPPWASTLMMRPR